MEYANQKKSKEVRVIIPSVLLAGCYIIKPAISILIYSGSAGPFFLKRKSHLVAPLAIVPVLIS